MRILYSKLINLPVYTVSNDLLGQVSDLEIDIDTYSILKIYVKSGNLIRGLFEDVLIIAQNQIIKITSKKIVVDDNVKKTRTYKKLELKLPANNKAAVMTAAYKE